MWYAIKIMHISYMIRKYKLETQQLYEDCKKIFYEESIKYFILFVYTSTLLNTLILEIKNACVCDYTYHAICLKVCGCLGF